MNNVLKVLVFIAVIFVVLHYRKYRYYTNVYQIDQQELEYIKGDDLYNQHNPLIITFIEDITLKENINEYRLFSLLSFNKNFTNIKSNGLYNVHPNELCLIRPKNEIRIELVNPKFKKYFKKNTNRGVFYNYVLEKENYERVESIEIILREYNILYVPRHWFFKINNGDEYIDVFTCDNLVSFFSKRLTTN